MARLLLLLFFLAAGLQVRAGRSSISGHVKASSGNALDSVVVRLVADGGWQFEVRADARGYFSITGLDARNYTAILSRNGFESQRFIDVRIDSGKVAHLGLDAALRPAHRRDARLTTVVYKKQIASPVAPGRWVTRKPELRRPKPGRNSPEAAPDKPAPSSAPAHATSRYAAPRIDAYEPAATRSTLDIAALSSRPSDGSRRNSIAIGGGRTTGTKVIIDGVAASPAADAFATAAPKTFVAAEATAGSLTSGEINDFAKWNLWDDISHKQLQEHRKTWPIRPENRISVLVRSANGAPLPNASVTLLEFGKPVWEGRTDNTGKAELWNELFSADHRYGSYMSLRVRIGGAEQLIHTAKPFDEGINVVQTSFPCSNPKKLDIAFLVDATGSMGDEINYLKAEFRDILQRVTDSMPLTHVQTGALFYRDRGDEYLVRSSALTDSFGLTEAFISGNSAAGGGDGPEAVESALAAALELGWRDDATARLAFLVLDAPPHSDSVTFRKMQALIRAYAARGIRLIPVACSGSDKPTEYLLRSMALATNGTYLFLTDHSGIGGAHTAPTTDKFDVEYLNGLIFRVIRSFSAMPECEPEQLASAGPVVGAQGSTSWRIYPNPTRDMLYVDHEAKSGYLYVTDISGKLVQRIAVDPGGHSSVDMRQYPAGVYSIRHSRSGENDVAETFVVRH